MGSDGRRSLPAGLAGQVREVTVKGSAQKGINLQVTLQSNPIYNQLFLSEVRSCGVFLACPSLGVAGFDLRNARARPFFLGLGPQLLANCRILVKRSPNGYGVTFPISHPPLYCMHTFDTRLPTRIPFSGPIAFISALRYPSSALVVL